MKSPKEKHWFISKINKKGRLRYVINIPDHSLKYGYKRVFLSASDMKSAYIEGCQVAESIKNNDYPTKEEQKATQKPRTVKPAISVFCSRREAGRSDSCQEHSISQITARFRNHFLPFFGNAKLSSIQLEDLIKYKQYLKNKGLSDRTISYCIGEAKEFFAYCVELEWLNRTPFDSTFKMAKPKPKTKRLPGDATEYQRLLMRNWKNPVFHAVALLCFFTGMRVSEIRALRKSDFEEFYGKNIAKDCVVIHISHSYTNKNVLKGTKNYHDRLTVIPRWVYEFIFPAIDISKCEIAFSLRKDKPISISRNLINFRSELYEVTGKNAQEQKAEGIVFHSLRKMFNSLMTGRLPSDIRKGILGWTDNDVGLSHYFKILPAHYQQILDAQQILFDDESIRWFKTHDILDYQGNRKYKYGG